MKVEFVFKRVEMKYLLTREIYEKILPLITAKTTPDEFGKTTIQSLYYDTDNYRIIRASIEKPSYKEKIRLRAYGLAKEDAKVYLELKKKAEDIVYKRRIGLKEKQAEEFFQEITPLPDKQISREITAFRNFYGHLKPSVLMLYDRMAFFGTEEEDVRITFDENIRFRTKDLNVHTSLEGQKIFQNNEVLMEIKTGTAVPLWLCKILSDYQIRKTQFSKYGFVYEHGYLTENKKEITHV